VAGFNEFAQGFITDTFDVVQRSGVEFDGEVASQEPELLSVEILRRAKLKGYSGGKTALYTLIGALRPKTIRPLVRFEGFAGEFTQHDFGHVDVRFLDRTETRVHFFASRLKYSRWVEVTIVPDERAETLVRTFVDHFAAIGGVPLLAVFDRPKTVALKRTRDGRVTEWNPIFAGVALDLCVGIEVCWRAAPWQKGGVENLVGWVKGSFFKQRRFVDDEDLLMQLAEWRTEVNTARPCRATKVIPAVRLAEERPRLRPPKVAPAELALRARLSTLEAADEPFTLLVVVLLLAIVSLSASRIPARRPARRSRHRAARTTITRSCQPLLLPPMSASLSVVATERNCASRAL
jgi:transposase